MQVMPFGVYIPLGTPGSMAEVSAHLRGESSTEWLTQQFSSRETVDRHTAIGDPKLPAALRRAALLTLLSGDADPAVGSMLLRNPSTTTEELESVATFFTLGLRTPFPSVGSYQLADVTSLYEHPHVSLMRRGEMLSTLRAGPALPQFKDAMTLRCAALHLDMSPAHMAELVGFWIAGITAHQRCRDERQQPPDDSLPTLIQLGVAAGRIISHPNTPEHLAADVMAHAESSGLSEVWEKTARSWMELRDRPRDRDWAMLTRLTESLDNPKTELSKECERLAVGFITTLQQEGPHPRDSDILFWAIERSEFATQFLSTLPSLEISVVWTRERVKQCLLSPKEHVRLYGLRGVEILAKTESRRKQSGAEALTGTGEATLESHPSSLSALRGDLGERDRRKTQRSSQ